MGTALQVPGTVSFQNPWSVNFYCLQNYNIRRILELSMLDTFNHRSSIGDIEPRDLETYKIILTLLNDKMEPLRHYTLYGTFVSSVDPIDYDATGNGAIKQVAANVSYQYWEGVDADNQLLTDIPLLKRDNPLNKRTSIQTVLDL
jgi:hypothetical protein